MADALWDDPFAPAATMTTGSLRSEPFESNPELEVCGGVNEVRGSSVEWDRANAGQLLRVMTVNMHGRPVDVAHSWFFGDLKLDSVNKSCQTDERMHLMCDDEWTLINAQDRRMRGFFQWLDRLPPHVAPHVICFQEIIWNPMIDVAEENLLKRGYLTLPAIALNQDRGCKTCIPPRMGSGLGIYVRTTLPKSTTPTAANQPGFDARLDLRVVDGGGEVFEDRLGADVLVEKGFKWALVRCRTPSLINGRREAFFVVMTCHPQAYNQLYTESAPGESLFVSFMRKAVRFGFDLKGGFPSAITHAHKSQYRQMAKYIQDTLLPRAYSSCRKSKAPLLGVFLAADTNVNRYAVAPESPEERSETLAHTPCVSNEFLAVVRTLRSTIPTLRQEPTPSLSPASNDPPADSTSTSSTGTGSGAVGVGDGFSWDSRRNTIAGPLARHQHHCFGWIDSVLACHLGVDKESGQRGMALPRYMDNRALAMRLPRPVPEISPFWTGACSRWRIRHLSARRAYRPVNREIRQRLELGMRQQRRLAALFVQSPSGPASYSPVPDSISPVSDSTGSEAWGKRKEWLDAQWRRFVLAAPYEWSSQLWKGIDFYGILTDDMYAIRETRHLRIGDPHPFRMIADVSDHHAVLARIILP